MLKQSYLYLCLQIINIFVGVLVSLYIAQNVDVNTFAVYAVYIIVTTQYMTFSFLGYETVLIRNLLHWQNTNQINRIKNLISYAIFSRIITSLILTIPILGYLYYLSVNKFEEKNFLLLSSFVLAGFFSALSNANGLILKAFNKYILSFAIITLCSLFGRVIALFAFIEIDFNAFILALVLSPILSFLISFIFIKDYFSIKKIKWKYFSKFKRYKYFVFSGYLNYFKVSIDQFLISILLSAEILAAYNLAKKIEELGQSIVEGFFDPIIQKIIKYKNMAQKVKEYQKKIYLIKNIFLTVTIVFVLIFDLYVKEIIHFAKLDHFSNLDVYMIAASWMPVLYLMYKVQSNIIYLFDSQKTLFKIDLYTGLLATCVAVICFLFGREEYVYLNKIITGIVLMIFFGYFYDKNYIKKARSQ